MKVEIMLLTLMSLPSAMAADFTKERVERKVRAHYEITLEVAEAKNSHFWYASPLELPYQSVTQAPSFSREPSKRFLDAAFGNQILYWKFEQEQEFTLRMDWELKVRNVLTHLDPARVGRYDTTSADYLLYTRSERLTHLSPRILEIRQEIERGLRGEKNPVMVARAAYQWVLDHMAYATLDKLNRDRGIDALLGHALTHNDLTYYMGDCGEYTLLYNAILRSFGIPARTATGGWSLGKDQWHVWSEVLFPGYGWVPVDTSAADVFVYDEGEALNRLGDKRFGSIPEVKDAFFYFGNLDPHRFVMTVGNDIPLQPVLDWDFSSDQLGWFYKGGDVGYIQLGIFHLPSVKNILIQFEEIP